jgi:hypothetical protein
MGQANTFQLHPPQSLAIDYRLQQELEHDLALRLMVEGDEQQLDIDKISGGYPFFFSAATGVDGAVIGRQAGFSITSATRPAFLVL